MVLKLGKAKKKAKKEFPAPIDGMRRQVGALPWRLGPAGLEIMLVSSRATRRWIVPKGWPMAGRADHVAAGIEAIEEAGLLGVIDEQSCGAFVYMKRFSRGEEPCEIKLYPLKVVRQRDKWPEKHERMTQWFSVEQAAQKVSDPGLAEVIRLFATRFAA